MGVRDIVSVPPAGSSPGSSAGACSSARRRRPSPMAAVAVGEHRRSLSMFRTTTATGRRGRVRDHLRPAPPDLLPRTSTATATSSARPVNCRPPRRLAARRHERLVDLDCACSGSRFALTIARRSQEDEPGGLVAGEAEHVLELEGRESGLVRGHPEGGPEPGQERRPRPVHDCAGGDRGLAAAGLALPQPATRQHERGVVAARRAAEAVGPAALRQVGQASLLVREHPVELGDVARIRRARHAPTLPPGRLGVNRISRTQ